MADHRIAQRAHLGLGRAGHGDGRHGGGKQQNFDFIGKSLS